MVDNLLALQPQLLFTLFNPRIVVNPIIVHPVDNVDIVVHKARNFALENHIVAQKDIFVSNTSLVVLNNDWKGMFLKTQFSVSKTKMHLVVETRSGSISSLHSKARKSANAAFGRPKYYQDYNPGLLWFVPLHFQPNQWRKESLRGRRESRTSEERRSRSLHPLRKRLSHSFGRPLKYKHQG